ncbi:AI-2E family transporter [Lutibacter sp. B2]|nr:AI-2E family transporter [Lutibacter sp. B2]
MKFKNNFNKSLNLLIIVIIGITYYKLMDNLDGVYLGISDNIRRILNVIKPFISGIVIAYILNPIVRWFERNVIKEIPYIKNRKQYHRVISTVLVFIIAIAVIVITLLHVMPRMVQNMTDLIGVLPSFVNDNQTKFTEWVHNLYKEDIYNITGIIEKNINSIFNKIGELFKNGLDNLLNSVIEFTSKTFSIIISLIVSFYILVDKESIIRSTMRTLRAFLSESKVKKFKDFCRDADNIFVKYVIGKSLDSFIIAVMAFIILTILKSPYIILITLTVGVTNMIPYFGPLIGEIVGFIFVSFYSPVKALWVLLVLFLLQQFDSFYLTPKILGDKMGLNPVWIIFSIVLGGSLFGVMGMFLGVPVISIIVMLVRRYVDQRLENK